MSEHDREVAKREAERRALTGSPTFTAAGAAPRAEEPTPGGPLLARAEAAYRAVIALPGTLGPEVCALVESHYALAAEVERLRASRPASAPAGTQRMLPHAAAWLRDLSDDANVTDEQSRNLTSIAEQLDRLDMTLRGAAPTASAAVRRVIDAWDAYAHTRDGADYYAETDDAVAALRDALGEPHPQPERRKA